MATYRLGLLPCSADIWYTASMPKLQGPGGGVYLGTEWIPTAKRPSGAEDVNVKNWGRSTPFFGKMRGGQLQIENIIVGAVTYKLLCSNSRAVTTSSLFL